MKRILAIVLCAVMVLAAVACAPAEKEYTLGMGVVVGLDSSATLKSNISVPSFSKK